MRKKTKLIGTIASVCLAIALVVFGVYASNIGAVGVSSTISYQSSGNLDVLILVTVEYSTDVVSYSSKNANTKYVDDTLSPSAGYTTINAWKISQNLSDEPLDLSGDNAINIGDYQFLSGAPNGASIKYTVTITNRGYYPVTIEKTEPVAVSEGVVTSVVESGSLSGTQNNQIPAKDVTTGNTFPYTLRQLIL